MINSFEPYIILFNVWKCIKSKIQQTLTDQKCLKISMKKNLKLIDSIEIYLDRKMIHLT